MKILQFSADWCGPCKMMKPRLESFATEMGDRVDLELINVDENADLTAKYEVKNIPTFIFIKDDKVVKRLIGAQPITQFKEIVTEYENQN